MSKYLKFFQDLENRPVFYIRLLAKVFKRYKMTLLMYSGGIYATAAEANTRIR